MLDRNLPKVPPRFADHTFLYSVIACADAALCAEALLTANWLAALCSFAAGVSYALLASRSRAGRQW